MPVRRLISIIFVRCLKYQETSLVDNMNYATYIESISFAQPVWLYIFAALSFFIVANNETSFSNILQRLTFKYTYYHPCYPLLARITNQQKAPLQNKNTTLKKIFHLMLIGFLFISLAEPYKIGNKIPDPPNNRDIAFLIDNEVSMVLKDYFIDKKRVDRLTMVKSVLLNFANKLSGNRISLITYSEEAHTLLPFTTDTNLIKAMIPRIEATLTGRTSNPQKALLYTLNYLHNTRVNTETSMPSIVLITDVLRPPRDINPNIVAEYIKQKGYKLYVVAIGSNTYNDSDADNSTLIYHPASFERLKNIAQSANGKFYWAKNTASLSGVIEEILKSKKSKIKAEPQYIKIPLFQWPLALFLILAFIHYLMPSLSFRSDNA